MGLGVRQALERRVHWPIGGVETGLDQEHNQEWLPTVRRSTSPLPHEAHGAQGIPMARPEGLEPPTF